MESSKKLELVELVTGGALSSLPSPRVQLTWQETEIDEDGYNVICHYHLVLPVHRYDIRNLTNCERDSFLLVELGGTKSDGGIKRRIYADGKIDMPFRDGSHIAWDAYRLSLPAFVVCGQSSMPIQARSATDNGEAA